MFNRLIAIAAIALTSSAAFAADPVTPSLDKKNAVSFSVGSSSSDISVRHMFADSKYAVLALVGYQSAKSTTDQPFGYSSSYHQLELGLALRRVFQPTEQLRPFAQVQVARLSGGNGVAGVGYYPGNNPYYSYSAVGGVEYFLGKRISVEGSAGVNYSNHSDTFTASDGTTSHYHTRSFGTFRSSIGVNFYF